jgi:hypothetical protein
MMQVAKMDHNLFAMSGPVDHGQNVMWASAMAEKKAPGQRS